jgi:hypothetical protein
MRNFLHWQSFSTIIFSWNEVLAVFNYLTKSLHFTPFSTILLEHAAVTEALSKFYVFHESRTSFYFIWACHLTLSRLRRIKPKSIHPVCIRSALIMYPCLSDFYFFQALQQNVDTFLVVVRVTCFAHLTLLDFIATILLNRKCARLCYFIFIRFRYCPEVLERTKTYR